MNKEELFEDFNKGKFMDFLQNDTTGEILQLFNNEYMNLLNNCRYKEDIICYILTYSKYANELFKNERFLSIFLNSNIGSYYASMSGLSKETYDLILNSIDVINNEKTFISLFSYFPIEYQLKLLDDWKYPNSLLYPILNKQNVPVINKILEKYNIDLSNDKLNIEGLIIHGKVAYYHEIQSRNMFDKQIEAIEISPLMITDELCNKMWKDYDIFKLRALINDAVYITDTTKLNNFVKQKEEEIILNSLSYDMISPFYELYNYFSKIINSNNDDEYSYNQKQYFELCKKIDSYIINDIKEIFSNEGLAGVEKYFKKLSSNMISNYIIDYHFEENYHNIMLDLRELLNFYFAGNINLSEEKIELYNKISNIDYLEMEEKIELHNLLKNFNIMEMFYDDMSLSRKIVNEAIKEYSLSSESIKQYRNEKLSKEYGIDVYTIEDNNFFALVKTGTNSRGHMLPTGHSFSLIGYDCMTVFGSAEDSDTYLYDTGSLNPNQIVHTYPFDSFTLYKPYSLSKNATNRVYTLMMPDELMQQTGHKYNEILILERGNKTTDMDKSIPRLQKMALYCINTIKEQDIEKAKQEGVGIFLVNGKNYHKPDKERTDIYRHDGLDYWNFKYFDGNFDKENFEKTR